jgi:hypothetical protein
MKKLHDPDIPAPGSDPLSHKKKGKDKSASAT